MKSFVTNWIWDNAPWIALLLLGVGAFTGLIATGFLFPLLLLCLGIGLLIYRYWESLKSFDFFALDEWVHARIDSVGIREWHTPYHAAERYCDPVVVRARNDAATKMNSIMMELIKNPDQKIDASNSASSSRFSDGFKMSSTLRQTSLHADYEAAQAKHDENNLVLARELLRRLVAGNLLAKGLPVENDVTRSERIIPASRWRIMGLNISKAEASGRGAHYIGIVIGQKPVVVKQVKTRPDEKSLHGNVPRQAESTKESSRAPKSPAR
ncbi:MAG TPA: hypothetical protein V6C69_01465 [Trichormus sp.]